MVNMMFRFVAMAITVLGLTAAAAAQEATATGSDAYPLAFENDYVRVERAHYPAGAKIASHAHPPSNTVYLYLNDSDGVIFRHTSGASHTVTRPPVKAGALRVSGGGNERHEVENTSKTASDFLRIIFKTDAGGARNARTRLSPTDVEFANQQMRITRFQIQPKQNMLIEAKSSPALRIALRQGVKQWNTPPPDFLRWLDKGTTEEFAVTGDFPVDIIRIEFLTKPKR